jgi:hypothetical protein
MGVLLLMGNTLAATNDPPVDSKKSLDEMRKRLAWVREGLELARHDVDKVNTSYFKAEHDIVYTNAVLNKLYLSMKALEKELTQKRQEFNDEVMKSPEMRNVVKARKVFYDKVKKLEDEESMLLHDIRVEEERTGTSVPAGKK